MEERLVVEIKVGKLLKDRGLTQSQLAEMAGIRQAAISQLSRGFIERLNLDHVEKIINALEIEDIREIIDINVESEVWNMTTVKEQREYLEAKKKGDTE
ncbi:helix-turn-helix transcriptional regulator [Bacillus tianshenii]|uniref:helix-turn-helix domain-containing protein n=1 Tax=Sutcliffiella tianshenii TaxID=1463404 RepID=UPI001CD5380A|nr:helix-turn-helix transcriptional regulator [Bacillus tianshenii]MCA1319781.1 helix-turn-helix transcriptional regulator [Bacillus tianshenii]